MRTGVIVAARFASSRLPGKAAMPLFGRPMLGLLLERLLHFDHGNQIIFATTTNKEDDLLANIAKERSVPVFRGSNEDVVDRYVRAADFFSFDRVVRVTADCPFLDGATLAHFLERSEKDSADLYTTKGIFPVGLDFEMYDCQKLAAAHLSSGKLSPTDREHLTKFFYDNRGTYQISEVTPPPSWPDAGEVSFTIDHPSDYEFALRLEGKLGNKWDFSIPELLETAKKL